jgi:hypothetical protein
MNLLYILLLSIAAILAVSYPIDCHEIGTSKHGTLKGCQIISDPLPLKWEVVITLDEDYTWRSNDDMFWIYANGDYPVSYNCSTASTLPGPYPKGTNITIQQTCYSFTPALKPGAHLSFWAFNSHSSRFDDPLIFELTIPSQKSLSLSQ